MRALILGGSGGLSSVLARKALTNYEVWTLTRGQRNLPAGVHALLADRNDEAGFAQAVLGAGVWWDVVFDCICMNERHASQDLQVIAEVTRRLVVISTDSVYDSRYKQAPQTEDGVFVEETGAPEACSYAGNKRKMEQVFETYFEKQRRVSGREGADSLQVTIFRPGHIYGPGFLAGCYPEQSRQAGLPDQILRGEPLKLVAEGIYLTQPIFVDDLADAMLDCVDQRAAFQEIFCIGGPKAMENRRYYEIMGEILGVPVTIEEIPLHGYFDSHPEYQGHLCHRVYDLSKLRNAGVKLPATSFREGMGIQLASMGYQIRETEWKVSPLISDHGVFQRNESIRLFGTGIPGRQVTARFWKEDACAAAHCAVDADGRWEMLLSPQEAGGPWRLSLACGDEQRHFSDLYVGDVWVLAGQSNMQLPMERVKYRFPEEYQNGTDQVVRQFLVPIGWNFQGEDEDVSEGRWICPKGPDIPLFSAVGYFFGKSLAEARQIPVGLILTAVGGTPIQAWMSRQAYEKSGAYEDGRTGGDGGVTVDLPDDETVAQVTARDEGRRADWYQRAGLDAKDAKADRVCWKSGQMWSMIDLDDWDRQQEIFREPGVYWLRKQISIPAEKVGCPARLSLGTITDADETFVNGKQVGAITYQYPPREYAFSGFPDTDNEIAVRMTVHRGPGGFTWGKRRCVIWEDGSRMELSGQWQWFMETKMEPLKPQTFFERYPVGMYQHMIAPLHRIAVRGVCWYQGEMNADDETSYPRYFRQMTADWRKRWGKENLPFLFVQLPNYDLADGGNWMQFRNMQQGLLRIPDTAMVVTLDCGEDNDLHPTDKKTVGERLSMAARKVVYGETGDLCCPVFASAERNGQEVLLHVQNGEQGLAVADGAAVRGFEFWSRETEEAFLGKAEAAICGSSIRIVIPEELGERPLVLRYGWNNQAGQANVCNGQGLPLSPFQVQVSGKNIEEK